MKDFLDKIKEKVDEGISNVSSKSKEAVELARLRSDLRHLEKEKEETINKLGNIVYDMLRRDEYNEQKIRDFYPQVSAINRQIVEVENEMRKIQEMASPDRTNIDSVCVCGTGLIANQKFCASCGRDVSGQTSQQAKVFEGIKACSSCGAEIKETAKFCGKCGAKQ